MSQTLRRGVTALAHLGEHPRTVGEVSTLLEVHPSTALRILQTLQEARFVERQDDRRYRLGAAFFGLASQALENLDLRQLAKPVMEKLRDVTGETIHLGILEGGNVVYIEKVDSQHPVRMYSRIGLIAPLHCTGIAKAILACLPDEQRRDLIASTRLLRHTSNTHTTVDSLERDLLEAGERGYATDDGEHEDGIHCIAAPIRHANGSVAGSLSVSVPMARMSRDELHALLPDLLHAVSEISGHLGFEVNPAA